MSSSRYHACVKLDDASHSTKAPFVLPAVVLTDEVSEVKAVLVSHERFLFRAAAGVAPWSFAPVL